MASILGRLNDSLEELANHECWHDVSGEVKGRYEAFFKAADVVRAQIETEEQSRQRFEAWLLSCGKALRFLSRDETGRYMYDDAYVKWQAWQASQTFTEVSE